MVKSFFVLILEIKVLNNIICLFLFKFLKYVFKCLFFLLVFIIKIFLDLKFILFIMFLI